MRNRTRGFSLTTSSSSCPMAILPKRRSRSEACVAVASSGLARFTKCPACRAGLRGDDFGAVGRACLPGSELGNGLGLEHHESSSGRSAYATTRIAAGMPKQCVMHVVITQRNSCFCTRRQSLHRLHLAGHIFTTAQRRLDLSMTIGALGYLHGFPIRKD